MDSDEEDGGDSQDIQDEFKNFTSTAPRFSHLLDQLSFDDIANAAGAMPSPVHKVELEPKHEKRDSGIAGFEESSEPVKILDGEEKKVTVLRQASVESGGTVEDKTDEHATDEEENVVTHIDEVCTN